MIVLRIAIGWHLMYEGYTKINATMEGTKPFSAEMYLRNSTGPLRFYFRGLIDDYHGLGMLDAKTVEAHWNSYLEAQAKSLGLSDEAKHRIDELVQANTTLLETYLNEKTSDIDKYKADIEVFEANEQRPLPGFGEMPDGELLRPPLPEFEWQTHKKAQRDLDKERVELTGPVMKWSSEIVAAVKDEAVAKKGVALKEGEKELGSQVESSAGADVPGITWRPQLAQINLTTMWGLAIVGGLMIVGLFTRTACLAGAALLTLFYLSMPPWPGLDPAPIAEGTYLFVNKNLVEIIALLMLATSPVGVWGGLDSLIRGFITRPVFGVGKKEVLTLE